MAHDVISTQNYITCACNNGITNNSIACNHIIFTIFLINKVHSKFSTLHLFHSYTHTHTHVSGGFFFGAQFSHLHPFGYLYSLEYFICCRFLFPYCVSSLANEYKKSLIERTYNKNYFKMQNTLHQNCPLSWQ